ncbi:hypothetical protein, partial [Bacillus sp. CHD6a]|uniref:hypothetical protein n=1 Tax=Bacillus sp. CHD6a TaxID=1643452 RepID=UPI001E657C17
AVSGGDKASLLPVYEDCGGFWRRQGFSATGLRRLLLFRAETGLLYYRFAKVDMVSARETSFY